MDEFIRMLVNQKLQEQQVQRWLNKSLQEYAAWEQHQKNVMEAAKQNQIIEDWLRNAFKTLQGYASGQPNAPQTYSSVGRELLPESMRGQIPEVSAPSVSNEEATGAMAKLLEGLETGQYPSIDELKKVLSSYGLKPAQQTYSQIEKSGREKQKLAINTSVELQKLRQRKKELEAKLKADRDKLKLGWAKLNQQIKKFKKGEATSKDSKELFKNYQSMIKIYDDQIKNLTDQKAALVGSPEAETMADEIQEKIDSLVKNKERLIRKAERYIQEQEVGTGSKEIISKERAREIYINELMKNGLSRGEAEKLANENPKYRL